MGWIHSMMSYGLLAYGHSSHVKKGYKLQGKAFRITSGLNNRDDCKNEFWRLNILTAPSVSTQECVTYVKKN